ITAACGDDDDDDSSAGTEAGATTPAATDAPADSVATTDGGTATTEGATADTGATTPDDGSVPAGTEVDCDLPYEDGDPDANVDFITSVPPRQFDPHISTSIIGEYAYIAAVYDRLIEQRKGPVLCPMIAESWEFNDDGTELTLHLDPDAVFWDGSPIDAEAVKANLTRAQTLETSTVKSFLNMVTAINVVDPQTVTLVANRPAADLPSTLSTLVGSMINPKAFTDGTDLATTPAGSGAYEIQDWVVNDNVTFVRKDDYWRPESAGKAKTLHYVGIPDDLNKLNAFRSGEADISFFKAASYGDFSDYAESTEGVSIAQYPQGATYQIFLNTDRPGLDNQQVRQALNYAIDRDAINEELLYGQCPPTSQMLQGIYPGHLPELDDYYNYDPEKAQQLLDEAGFSDGFSFEIGAGAGLTPQALFGPVIQAQLAPLGIDVTVTEGDLLDINSRWAAGELDAYAQTRLGAADAGVVLRDNYTKGSRFPGTPPQEVTDAINATLDPTVTGDDRTALLEAANTLITEQALDLFICGTSATFIHTDDVLNADIMGQADYQGIFDMRYVTMSGS
ncbi:MAG: ABC transporter substrate-binding protein, partial [Ilumatobacteraceae bacterium]